MRCPKSRFPICIIVFVFVSQGLTLSTASLVSAFIPFQVNIRPNNLACSTISILSFFKNMSVVNWYLFVKLKTILFVFLAFNYKGLVFIMWPEQPLWPPEHLQCCSLVCSSFVPGNKLYDRCHIYFIF